MNIPDYVLLHCCGRGAYGEVWLAKDRAGRSVALKYLANSMASEKELAGLKNYAKLPDSPHLIRVLHVGETDDGFFYTMELADCLYQDGLYTPVTLAYKLKIRKRFTPAETVSLGIDLADGLTCLHQAGLIHRDIKPENILYVKGIPKLSDVGLVRSTEQTLSVGGTLGFIPPERLTPGSSTSGSQASDDVYALGKVLYCAMTGNKVEDFPSFPPDLMQDHTGKQMNKIILKACGPERNRFSNPEEFQTALQNITQVESPRRKSTRIYLIIIVLLLIITVTLLFHKKDNQQEVAAVKNETVIENKDTDTGDQKVKEETAQEETTQEEPTVPRIKEQNRERLTRLYSGTPRSTLEKKKDKLIEDIIAAKVGSEDMDDMREELEIIRKILSQQPAAGGKRKQAQKNEEDPGGLAYISGLELDFLQFGNIVYHPQKDDAIHLGHDFNEIDHPHRVNNLVCSAPDLLSPEWDLSQASFIESRRAPNGRCRIKKMLPDEYAVQFDLETTETKLPDYRLLFSIMKNEETQRPGISFYIAMRRGKSSLQNVGYTLKGGICNGWSCHEEGEQKWYFKTSFRVTIVRTNLQFRIYFDNELMEHLPSHFGGGYFDYYSTNPNNCILKNLKVYDIHEAGKREKLKPEEEFHLPQ